MRRSIFEFPSPEIEYLASLFTNLERDLDKKIQSAFAQQHLTVELSEQELETIIDRLPIPGTDDLADSLRIKLTMLFRQLK
jgi:hypothetical protein